MLQTILLDIVKYGPSILALIEDIEKEMNSNVTSVENVEPEIKKAIQ